MQIKVLIQKLCEDAIIPKYAHEGDAGVDLYSRIDHEIKPGERFLIPTGLKMAIPHGFEGQVRPKSGLALKSGITVLNTPGTVDAPYRGEVGVIVINHHNEPYNIKKGEKIAQGVFVKVNQFDFEEVEHIKEESRGGFGSTDLKKKAEGISSPSSHQNPVTGSVEV